MRIIIEDKKKKVDLVALCDVPTGYVFKFKGSKVPMLRLASNCGYCEIGEAWESVEELDREKIQDNTEQVKVYGKLKALVV